jgi:redox-sensing transcriptional repressor
MTLNQSPSTAAGETVPKSVVSRLSLYLRELQQLSADGTSTISSIKLGQRLGLTDTQVRKDLAYFGQFGFPGIGYRCDQLAMELRRILGTDRQWPVALVGCGNLGQALLGYSGFGKQGFSVALAFDNNPQLIGRVFGQVTIRSVDEFETEMRRHQVRLAILAVPVEAAQATADRMIEAGIRGILNFAPVTLIAPPNVEVVGVDLANVLEQLSFAVVTGSRKS